MLQLTRRSINLVRKHIINLPLGFGIFSHGITNRIHLFPAFSPLVSVPLLSAHIDNLQLITPSPRVLFLVPDAVSLYSPLSRALPLHDTSTLVGGQYYDKLVSTSEDVGFAVHLV
jgi:hypothetical protein